MKLLALALLLSSFSSLTLTEVVNSFKQSCPTFFTRNPKKTDDHIVPTRFSGRQYKKICQRWKNIYRFATLYDTEKRIPVYSAYTFTQEAQTKRSEEWKIEPQLENIEGSKEMIDSPREAENITHQAVSSDYKDTNYTRGHVFPRSFAADQDQADSTFTLTNIAPQTKNSNEMWAKKVENPMPKIIKEMCRLDEKHRVYIVTGVVPGKEWMPLKRNDEIPEGINIPSHYWSAFCCTNKTNINNLVFKAYIAELQKNVSYPSIGNLNKRLKKLYNKEDFNVFPGLSV